MIFAQIDVSKNILAQFAQQLGLSSENDVLKIDSRIGRGSAGFKSFNGTLELYHFVTTLHQPFHMESHNPVDSDWLLININLSRSISKKEVNSEHIEFQKYLPSGMLLYTPNTSVKNVSLPNEDLEIVLIRFHKIFLQEYSLQDVEVFKSPKNNVVYEDLDYESEKILRTTLESKDSSLKMHGGLLTFLGLFVKKLRKREAFENAKPIHPDDLKSLFIACSQIRNPVLQKVPSISELSQLSGMGSTKFKMMFKRVFGLPPLQYHNKIRLEYAYEQLVSKRKTPSELSYELGYSHPSKFTRAYKNFHGKLPSSY
ncbi:MAG: AraC family transcriptional regulator [Bacteroidota bacterium]